MNHALIRRLLAIALTTVFASAQAQQPEATPQELADLESAAPNLVAAIECKRKLVYSDAVKAFVKDPNSFENIILPAPVSIFGLRTVVIGVTEDDGNGGGGYVAKFSNVSLKEVAKAARVKAPSYKRVVKGGGMIEVGSEDNETVYITCVRGASDD
ncbi:hypothetical protein F2P44_24020 [Massilia sp. CCM 8695]|uniref:Uncharacterized protein n=1 Tax=Massilia frigida TaxID=2609281 RepID=A0ABX0NAI8_9BURK|nr:MULTISPECIES: hypothetical protein [Massilia]MDM5175727.1 hypothetical protein [Massilia sp. DJPM01]NHZ82323.1 hypothetical protein [Massilia frigida]